MSSLLSANKRPRFTPALWAHVFIFPDLHSSRLLLPILLRTPSPGLLHTNRETSKSSISMLLGKRPRPPMKRTSSISEITFDLNTSMDVPPTDPNKPPNRQTPEDPPAAGQQPGGFNWLDQRALAPVSPRNHTRHSADLVETADFLRACSLCKRRLVPSRDIYMYKGDSAFCSLECRQQQMIQDERKEKCSLASNKQVVAPPSGSQVTTEGESVAAL